jgi:hypothetical protein
MNTRTRTFWGPPFHWRPPVEMEAPMVPPLPEPATSLPSGAAAQKATCAEECCDLPEGLGDAVRKIQGDLTDLFERALALQAGVRERGDSLDSERNLHHLSARLSGLVGFIEQALIVSERLVQTTISSWSD